MPVIPFCDTPIQAVLAAAGGGIMGGALGLVAGLDLISVALLAGAIGGLVDIGVHVVGDDTQIRAAVANVKKRATQFVRGAP